ncbi:MAG TPA: hypothetical protein VHC98_02485 [Candidatus Saccharimonadales bacterium]|nr:hypothetical protein [Candidatus Saccharimonadales bacterium]
MTQVINQTVDINAFYFVGKELKTFPRQIEYGGRAVTFGSGLRLRVEREGRSVFFFHMSALDGETYKLRQDGDEWTLEGVL